jgi:hypothetical protein
MPGTIPAVKNGKEDWRYGWFALGIDRSAGGALAHRLPDSACRWASDSPASHHRVDPVSLESAIPSSSSLTTPYHRQTLGKDEAA